MQQTIADKFTSDPRVSLAKRLLLMALLDHQSAITGIRPPDPDLQADYAETIAEFGVVRGGDLFYPYLGSGIGKGPFVELADGSIKYDFISGIGVHYWGHSHPEVVAASIDAAVRDTVMQGNLQQNAESADLAEIVLSAATRKGAKLKHCFFTTSGAMANENALKLTLQKRSPADRVLAFEGCFAGRTLALSQVTDKPAYREGLPLNLAVDYLPFFDPVRPEASTLSATEQLRKYLARYPKRHAAMIFELVQGEGGFYPGDATFFRALIEILKEHGVTVMVDEIQTFGRTSELFAFSHYGLDDAVDVVTLGKLSQVCATLFAEDHKPRPGLLSQTFTAGTQALFTARVIVKGLIEGDYFGPEGSIARLHDHFVRRLKEIGHRHPGLIEGPFGIGAMIACTPFGGDAVMVKKLIHALFDAGVIAFYCGSHVSRVRFLVPAGAVTTEHIDDVTRILEETLVLVAESE
jgi:4-aminobutyrate aminotransferase-like enzyme